MTASSDDVVVDCRGAPNRMKAVQKRALVIPRTESDDTGRESTM
jgi:hypothetical protein